MNSTEDRKIRSYVLRQGRLTAGQERALEVHWSHYGLSTADSLLDFNRLFEVQRPMVFEIGFGMGDSLVEQAVIHPDINYLGTEMHRPGVGHLLIQAAEKQLDNLRVFNEDGLEVLERFIPDHVLQGIQLYFPDPWHKKRHHKRRIFNAAFLELAARKLLKGGFIHVATDWVPYAEEIETLMSAHPAFDPMDAPARPETKFEKRGIRLGHEVRDLACCYSPCS
ncbi:MAG: tRNA (guanosine(46)-N7)-methyltransferase TrmB [Proteobacteria bacterium]|nr:tRNA (guanosine(46)-N7)-methyltransferase TrmB [Pseudomonadota bacterium]